MSKTTVLSIRVSKDIIERLKEKGIKPSSIAKKALENAHKELLLREIYKDAKRLENISKRDVLKAVEKGRA